MTSLVEAYALTTISPAVWDQLVSMARSIHFEEGDYIFREGDHALNLYILKEGEVAIEQNVPPQGNVTWMTIGPGEWFSWSALLEPRIARASARVTERSEVWAIRGGAIMDRCIEDHEFGFQIYRALAEMIARRLTYSSLQLLQLLSP